MDSEPVKFPPVMPCSIWIQRRADELFAAIALRRQHEQPVPAAWLHELAMFASLRETIERWEAQS